MAEKPRNPRRPAGGPGDRPNKFGRAAGKPVKGPGYQQRTGRSATERVGGVDARAMETLEKEGLLSAEGRKLLAQSGGKVQMNRGLKVKGAVAGRSERPSPKGERPDFNKGERPDFRGERPGLPKGERPEPKAADRPERGNRTGGKPAGRPVRGKARSLDLAEQAVAERLQKVMAKGGVASRRHSEELIQAGRVTVNGQVVTELGSKVVPRKDLIEVDGRPLGRAESLIYLVLNKPKGFVTTLFDPQGRPKVTDLLGDEIGQRVYPVGRLDYDTEGLILMTNDGELANALMHPAKMIKKTYIAKVRGVPGPMKLKQLEAGVELADGVTAPADVRLIEAKGPNSATVSLRIHEGRNRQVRRMFEALGHEVIHLKRTTLGPVHLKELPLGEWRQLSQHEVKELRIAAGLKPPVGELAEERKPRPQQQQQRPAVRRGAGRTAPPERVFEDGGRPVGRRPGRVAGPSPFAQTGEEQPAGRRPFRPGGPSPFRAKDPNPFEGAVGLPTVNDEFERPDPRPTRRPNRGPGGELGKAPDRAPGKPFGKGDGRPAGKGFGKGPDRAPGKPFAKGEGRGPDRGPDRGPARGPDRGPDRGPARGPKVGVRKTRSPK